MGPKGEKLLKVQASGALQEHLSTGKPSQAQEPNVLKPTLDYHLRNPWGSLAQAPEPRETPFLVSSLCGHLFSCPKAILIVRCVSPSPTKPCFQFVSHRPLVVSTMMAAAQHLKAASTAPIAVISVGSRLSGAARRSSSNNWRWYTAASASRAICRHQ